MPGFPTTALSSSSEPRQRGTPCEGISDCLNDHVAESGTLSLVLFQCCSERMASHGAQVSLAKTRRDFENRNGTAAHLQEFLRSGRSSATRRTCLREVIIRITRSPKRTFGAMTRARLITIATF